MSENLYRTINAAADERIEIAAAHEREIIVAVLPDEDEDDCLTEAAEYVAGFYADHPSVGSVFCDGWEGGPDGPRERVLVCIRGRGLFDLSRD